MKKLEIKQMENTYGGDWWSCGASIVGMGLLIAGTAAAATITAGGALLFMGGFTYGGISTAVNCAKALMNE
jgi:hypothetical protein